MNSKTEFVDAQMMHEANPNNFEVPTITELNELKEGDTVKVCIAGERFWATIENISGDKIEAEVDNDLVCTDQHGFELGDIINFEKKNIYSIYTN